MPNRPNTEPLRIPSGAIVVDDVQRKLDAAKAAYRREYDRGYGLAERGSDIEAQRILDRANAKLREAEVEYEASRRAACDCDQHRHGEQGLNCPWGKETRSA